MGSYPFLNIKKNFFNWVEGLPEEEDNHVPQNDYIRMF